MSSLRSIRRNRTRLAAMYQLSRGDAKCPKCGKPLKQDTPGSRNVHCTECTWKGRVK